MPVIETLATALGGAISRALIKRWTADSDLASDLGGDLTDLLTKAGLDYRERERARRQLDEIALQIAERLEPYFSSEFAAGVPEGEADAAAFQVSKTIELGFTDPKLALTVDLDSERLLETLRRSDAHATRDLGEAGAALYDLALAESCKYLVEMVSALPEFASMATSELLARDRGLQQVLEDVLSQVASLEDRGQLATAYDARYRRAVARQLEKIRLFGLPTVRRDIKRYDLSVAYIGLGASRLTSAWDEDPDEHEHEIVVDDRPLSVEQALTAARCVLIRGEAGSGKTTLLQWFAVNAASKTLPTELSHVNDAVPFFLRLRSFVDQALPRPEAFADEVAGAISGLRPARWVEERLDEGAVVLIDGIDELPPERRPEVEEWLEQLVNDFPAARWVVTSRPAAVGSGFEPPPAFAEFELLPMAPSDVAKFIDHWHNAVAKYQQPEDRAGFLLQGEKLAALVRQESALRRLATNPLLCAVLCALHVDLRDALPRDRIGLYRAALDTLLFRRDAERGVVQSIRLSQDQIYLLLADLSWWMVSNDYTQAQGDAMRRRLKNTLARMGDAPTADEVLRHLVARTGLITEPTVDRFEFIHRTFLEFLAATHAADAQETTVVLSHAMRDDWEEITKLTIGVADSSTRTRFVRRLLERSDASESERARLLLLAAAGAAAAPELEPAVRQDLSRRLSDLVPPTSFSQAAQLAKAGDVAVAALGNPGGLSSNDAAASVRALRLIGGPEALDQIVGYAGDGRKPVVKELVAGLADFETDEYARRVLADSPLDNGELVVRDPADLRHLTHLKNLKSLCLAGGTYLDLASIGELTGLTRLAIAEAVDLVDLGPLLTLPALTHLRIEQANYLVAVSPPHESNVAPLVSLSLCGMELLTELDGLANVAPTLQTLELQQVGASDLASLSKLEELTTLCLNNMVVEGFSFVEDLPRLRRFELGSHAGPDGDLRWLSVAPGLREVVISGCTEDLLFESFKRPLQSFSVVECPDFDGSWLQGVSGLGRLTVAGTERRHVDLSAAGCHSLVLDGCLSATRLRLPAVTDVTIHSCPRLTSLECLRQHPTVERLTLADCPGLVDVSAIETCRSLKELILDSPTAHRVREERLHLHGVTETLIL